MHAGAVGESERRGELFAPAVAWRVDEDDPATLRECSAWAAHMSPVISRLGQNMIASPLPRVCTRNRPSAVSTVSSPPPSER